MKNFFSFKGISRALIFQILLISVGLIALDITVVGLYNYKAQENIKDNTFDQVQIIKAAILQPLWNLDHKSMQQIIDSILAQRSGLIAGVRVIESDSASAPSNYILDRHSPKWINSSFEELKGNPEFIHWELPVVYKGNHLGSIQVIFSVAESQAEVAKVSFLLGAVLIFFSGLCLLVFITLHLRRLSNELQKQVEERTQQLDTQRMAMVNSSRLASLGEMSAGIAHEINNPLAVIDGTIRLISREISTNSDTEKIEIYLGKVAKMVVRIKKIIDGLRAFSRDGSQEPLTNFHLDKFFNDISDLCHANLSHKNVDIQFKIEDPNSIIVGREVQLSQVMINMINNSADAVETLAEKWIRVDCHSEGENIVIAITDSGAGISKEIQTKMLQPFFTTKELGKGTGLGLSISIGIIEAHGGTLTYCQNHKNTRFEIKLKKAILIGLPQAA